MSDNFPDLKFQLIQSVSWSGLLTGFRSQIPLYTDIGIAALTIAIIAILETIISAKIADRMTKTKFHEQKEIL
ncbi:hypothetical protein KA037_04120 [Patescibacteria group bacterium]|nr:hypothetical protein [Patescibacteria group bacterium]MBP7841826.1 hypothetical protein [Patescibacteria group bacterium]